jgi:hypothetical protein
MKLAILGIDRAKSVFHLHGADARGREVVAADAKLIRVAD